MALQFFKKLRSQCRLPDRTENMPKGEELGDPIIMSVNAGANWSDFEGSYAADVRKGSDKLGIGEKFLNELVRILLVYIKAEHNRNSKVLDFHHPHQLKEMMAHCIDVDEKPRDFEQILSDCKETLKYCVKTGHPRFLNQLSTGLDIVGTAGEWLTAVANTNMFTYEVAPVFTLMEEVVLKRMLGHIGWLNGDGIFSPGGAISNLYAILLARHKKFPEVKHSGMQSMSQMVIFTSSQCHFSIKRGASLLGIGCDNVILIQCDSRGKMIPSDLELKIKTALSEGKVPIMVNATCGTTVLGAYDPVNAIADVCELYGVWLHVDGAWGGSALLSREHRYLLSGIERADSMTWNPHKMMGVPLQCSVVLLKQKGLLQSVNEMNADYLYQPDKNYDISYDTGDKAVQCGRHNDIFKFWLSWRAKGDEGFEKQINHNFKLSKYLVKKISERDRFQLVLNQIEGPNVCFWYIPMHVDEITDLEERRTELHKVAPQLKAAMLQKGSMMLTYQPLGNLPNFFRIAVSNPSLTTDDIDFVLDEVENIAKEIF